MCAAKMSKSIRFVAIRCVGSSSNYPQKLVFGRCSAPGPTWGAYDAPKLLVRLGRGTPPPYTLPLDPFVVSIVRPQRTFLYGYACHCLSVRLSVCDSEHCG